MNHQAIYNTYPNVLYIHGNVAYNSNNQAVAIDQAVYDSGLIQLEEQQEARQALRQSMITKLATTLTPEETALLEELL